MTAGFEALDDPQRAFVKAVIANPALVEDMSWGQTDTAVLRVRVGDCDYVVKAAGPGNHHIGREITAYETATRTLENDDRCGRMIAARREINILVTTYQPGDLIEGTTNELRPDVHRQAGRVLALLHRQDARVDPTYEREMTDKALVLLERKHRIDPGIRDRAAMILGAYETEPVVVVPAHGDWQPRNWLGDSEHLRVIDFGRFAYRPASSDLCRLAVQQWRDRPDLESAFLQGYVSNPRDSLRWPIELLREAIGTAVWAFEVGDEEFEAQGHRMLADAVGRA